MNTSVEPLINRLPTSSIERVGRVVRAYGTSIRAKGLDAQVGSRVEIINQCDRPIGEGTGARATSLLADVVGIDEDQLLLFPLGSIEGIRLGSVVKQAKASHKAPFSTKMLGGVYDALGSRLDDAEAPIAERYLPLNADAPSPLRRSPINLVFSTGVSAIDGLLTVGRGQRMGIFAPAGGGKSYILGMFAANSCADVIVLALIGERGREVAEFVNEQLTEETRQRTVIVVSPSDRPAMERVQAARFATAIAEGFRSEGKDVLLLLDSMTRYARALRDVGLSTGEMPVRKGFPGSVFADLPKLLERAGTDEHGSITAFYTVLIEDVDSVDVIGEEVRSILDGHIILSRDLSERGHYPAIDILSSTSRLFLSLATDEHQAHASRVRELMAKYAEVEFLIQVGEYTSGNDLLADDAVAKHENILDYLQQSHTTSVEYSESISRLGECSG